MKEQGKQGAESVGQIGEKLIQFIETAEFGSPEYQATSDYLFLRQCEESLKHEQQNGWESQARITEQKIALLQLSIYQNQSRIKGYDHAYSHVGIEFEHGLIDAARREARELFPNHPEHQNYHVGNLYETFFDRAQDIINTKRG